MQGRCHVCKGQLGMVTPAGRLQPGRMAESERDSKERQKTALPPQWAKIHKTLLNIQEGKGKMVVLLQGWCSVLHAGGEMFLLVNP